MEQHKEPAPQDVNASHVKWGMFYYNKNDKRIFPPKVYGTGYTINFANPASVGALIAILVGINVLTFLLIHLLTAKN